MGKLLKVVAVRLTCHHYATTTDQGVSWTQPVYCPQCPGYRMATTVLRNNGRTVCRTCGARGWAYKGRVDRAEVHAYSHSAKNPSHIVECWEGAKLLFRTTLAKVQDELPLWQEPPPF